MRGVVLETFGSGNAPHRSDLSAAIKEACDRGVVIVAISQCAKGGVGNIYEAGQRLLETGVVAGGDMTPEVCADTLFLTSFLTLLPVCAHQAELPSFET